MRDFVFLKNNGKCTPIFFIDLLYVEAVNKYVRFVTLKKNYFVLGGLTHVETRLPPDQFCRVHRSYIISLRHIIEFNHETILIADKEFPLGKHYKRTFQDKADILNADGSNSVKFLGDAVDRIVDKL